MDGDQEEPEPSSSFLYEESDDSDSSNECQPSQAYGRYQIQQRISDLNFGVREISNPSSHRNQESNEAEAGPSSSSQNKRKTIEDSLDQECSSSSGRRQSRPSIEDPVSSPSVSFSLFASPSTSNSGSRYARNPTPESDSDDDDFQFRPRKRMRVDDAEAVAVVSSPSIRVQPIQRFEADSCLVSSSTGAVDSPSAADRLSPDPFTLNSGLGSGVDSTSEGNLPLLDTSDEEATHNFEDPQREASPKALSNPHSPCGGNRIGSSLFRTKPLKQSAQKNSSLLDDLLAVPGPSGIKPIRQSEKENEPQSPIDISSNKPHINDDDDDSSNDSSSERRQVMHCVPEFAGSFANTLMNRKILDFDQQYMMDLDTFEDVARTSKQSVDLKNVVECASASNESKLQAAVFIVDHGDQSTGGVDTNLSVDEVKVGAPIEQEDFAKWVTQDLTEGHHMKNLDKSEDCRGYPHFEEEDQAPPVILDLQPVVAAPPSEEPLVTEAVNGSSGDIPDKFWCEECEEFLPEECLTHAVYAIVDKQVATRPWASLPAQYLVIKNIASGESCVIAKKPIGKRILFGPLEGQFVEGPAENHPQSYPATSDDGVVGHIDTNDDAVSNWMKLVRRAENLGHMNCAVMEERNKIYFITTEKIDAKQELRVGFSKAYAAKYNLPQLSPTEQEQQEEEMKRNSWQCYECDQNFETSHLLQSHLSIHEPVALKKSKRKCRRKTQKEPVQKEKEEKDSTDPHSESPKVRLHSCSNCDYRFPTEQLLQAHSTCHSQLIHENSSSTVCPQCSLECGEHEKLWQHVNSHGQTSHEMKATNLHKCNLCYKSFLNEQKLQKHQMTHDKDSEKNFECHLCLRKLCNKAALDSHLKFHAGESVQAYKCPICKQSFSSVILLKSHIIVHRIDGSYTCPTCQKRFNVYAKIRRHIRTYHPEKKEICSVCGRSVSSLEKLKLHMLTHSDERNFPCSQCTKSFKRKDKLKDHQKRIHSKDAKVTKVPEKTVSQKEVEKVAFKCGVCLLGFKRRGMLVNHMSSKHPEIPLSSVPELNQPILKECRQYYCLYCQKSYGTSMKRRLHIQKHHAGMGTEPLTSSRSNSVVVAPKKSYAVSCHLCPRQYLSNAKLLQHQRKCHVQQEPNNNKSPKVKQDATVEPQVSEPIVVDGYSRPFMLNRSLDSQAIFALVTQDHADPYCCITLPSQLDLMEIGAPDVAEENADSRDNGTNAWECMDNINEDSAVWQ